MASSYRPNGLNRGISRRSLLKGAAVGAGALLLDRFSAGGAYAAAGPSTKTESYLLPSAPGVSTTSLLTTGDSIGGYRMVGIPDGLGAYMDGGNIKLLMNHEIPVEGGKPLGITRGHGSPGAFVSQWTIDPKTMAVTAGKDMVSSPSSMYLWDPAKNAYVTGTTVLQRQCSADLPAVSALSSGALGTTDRIFLNGEEINEGRAWAYIATGPSAGQAWELPRLGKLAWENAVAAPGSKDKTVVICPDDGSLPPAAGAVPTASTNPAEVYVYVGQKQASGNPIERAGLTNGKLYGIVARAPDNRIIEVESNAYGLGINNAVWASTAAFELVELGAAGDVSALSGLKLEEDTLAKKMLRFQRPEDGAWDPRPGKENDFYFVTTGSMLLSARLWRLRFNNVQNPLAGGTIEILLRGFEGHHMFDNITIDSLGRILIQEDSGNDPWVARIWVYGIDSGRFFEVAHHDTNIFLPSSPSFLTQDEESSGIIDAGALLGAGWFLADAQVHKVNADPELVEGGQLVALFVPPAMR